MKIGLRSIYSDQYYGMPKCHAESLMEVARASTTAFVVRPISKFAKYFIEQNYPTKPFCVKNKTAKLGVAAGLIPIAVDFSHPQGQNDEHYAQLLIDAYQKDPSLNPIPLSLSLDRLMELKLLFEKDFLLSLVAGLTDTYKISWNRSGVMKHAYAKANDSTGQYDILDEKGDVILVLGKVMATGNGLIEKPITSDYDLLAVMPTYQSFDPRYLDKTLFKTQGQGKAAYERNKTAVIKSTEKDYQGQQEDSKAGNWSPRIAALVKQINLTIGATDHCRSTSDLYTMHHNAEFNNPFASDIANNFPALLILPLPMDLSHFSHFTADQANCDLNHIDSVLLESVQEMRLMWNYLRLQGYYCTTHAKYREDIPPFRAEAVTAAKQGVEALLNGVNHTKSLSEKIYRIKQIFLKRMLFNSSGFQGFFQSKIKISPIATEEVKLLSTDVHFSNKEHYSPKFFNDHKKIKPVEMVPPKQDCFPLTGTRSFHYLAQTH